MLTDTVTPRAVRKPAFDVDAIRSFEHKIEIGLLIYLRLSTNSASSLERISLKRRNKSTLMNEPVNDHLDSYRADHPPSQRFTVLYSCHQPGNYRPCRPCNAGSRGPIGGSDAVPVSACLWIECLTIFLFISTWCLLQRRRARSKIWSYATGA